jgi:hypothetical protein
MIVQLRRQVDALRRTLEARPTRPPAEPVTDRQRAQGIVNLIRYLSSRWPSARWDHACELIDWFTALPSPTEEQVTTFLSDIHAAWTAAVTAPPDADEEETV